MPVVENLVLLAMTKIFEKNPLTFAKFRANLDWHFFETRCREGPENFTSCTCSVDLHTRTVHRLHVVLFSIPANKWDRVNGIACWKLVLGLESFSHSMQQHVFPMRSYCVQESTSH